MNVAAELAVSASLEDRDLLMQRVDAIVTERERLFSLLDERPGVKPWPSQANFILCQFSDGKGKEVYEGLARRGVFVRYFSDPRLSSFVRASVGLPTRPTH